MSLPSRERGLKYMTCSMMKGRKAVAPLAGAWIEIGQDPPDIEPINRRSPRGSVD